MKEKVEELKRKLSPAWILDCVMVEGSSLVIAPRYLWENGIKKIKITKSKFGSATVLTYNLEEIFKKEK